MLFFRLHIVVPQRSRKNFIHNALSKASLPQGAEALAALGMALKLCHAQLHELLEPRLVLKSVGITTLNER